MLAAAMRANGGVMALAAAGDAAGAAGSTGAAADAASGGYGADDGVTVSADDSRAAQIQGGAR